MKKFDIVRLPLMNETGEWVPVTGTNWNVSLNRSGFLDVRHGGLRCTLPLSNAFAVDIADEKKVNAFGKTLGRMALTGVGAALFSRGSEGGFGAGLLDLSFRGAEKKSVISGLIIFQNTAVIRFVLNGHEFENLLALVPNHSVSEEAIERASEYLSLLPRMKADGERVLSEMVVALIERKSEVAELAALTTSGQSFQERDEARGHLVPAELRFNQEKSLLAGLLYDFRINPSTFVADHPSLHLEDFTTDVAQLRSPNASKQSALGETSLAALRKSPEEGVSKARVIAVAVIVVVVCLLWLLGHS